MPPGPRGLPAAPGGKVLLLLRFCLVRLVPGEMTGPAEPPDHHRLPVIVMVRDQQTPAYRVHAGEAAAVLTLLRPYQCASLDRPLDLLAEGKAVDPRGAAVERVAGAALPDIKHRLRHIRPDPRSDGVHVYAVLPAQSAQGRTEAVLPGHFTRYVGHHSSFLVFHRRMDAVIDGADTNG